MTSFDPYLGCSRRSEGVTTKRHTDGEDADGACFVYRVVKCTTTPADHTDAAAHSNPNSTSTPAPIAFRV
jgi:hypothetical protein